MNHTAQWSGNPHFPLECATGKRDFRNRSNENANGLLRQYFPKGTSLSEFDQADLDTVAESLNARPRKALGFATPEERFKRLLAGLVREELETSEDVRSGT